jgi:hypothetical protein
VEDQELKYLIGIKPLKIQGGVFEISYATTNQNLIGKFRVKNHARERLKDRKGETKVGNKKIKNMGKHRLNRLITKSLRKRRLNVYKQDDGALRVKTKDFTAIVIPGFHNHVITILP